MSYLERFRSDFATLFTAYADHTGARKTEISKVIAGYPNFYLYAPQADISGGKYDRYLARFSAVWPADLPWPEGIERPAPATDDDIIAPQARVAAPSHSEKSDWPADQPWPADIPRPVASSQSVDGQGA